MHIVGAVRLLMEVTADRDCYWMAGARLASGCSPSPHGSHCDLLQEDFPYRGREFWKSCRFGCMSFDVSIEPRCTKPERTQVQGDSRSHVLHRHVPFR